MTSFGVPLPSKGIDYLRRDERVLTYLCRIIATLTSYGFENVRHFSLTHPRVTSVISIPSLRSEIHLFKNETSIVIRNSALKGCDTKAVTPAPIRSVLCPPASASSSEDEIVRFLMSVVVAECHVIAP